MADTKITALTAIGANPINVATFPIPMVDLLDNSMAASGTTKKVTVNQILGAGGTATLASATISGDLAVDTSTLKVDSANDLVGVGTASPNAWGAKLVSLRSTTGISFTGVWNDGVNSPRLEIGHTSTGSYLNASSGSGGAYSRLRFQVAGADQYQIDTSGVFTWYDGAGGTRMTLNSTGLNIANGNVILGTSGKGIDFSATASGSGTMTSELLSDYEEGTWTIGLAFGGGSTGITTSSNTGRYTKVGRVVTVSGLVVLTNKGSSTGAASVTGLPFSIGNNNESYPAASLRLNGISYTGAFQAFGTIGSTFISFEQISTAGTVTSLTDSNFTNVSSFIFSLTYTV